MTPSVPVDLRHLIDMTGRTEETRRDRSPFLDEIAERVNPNQALDAVDRIIRLKFLAMLAISEIDRPPTKMIVVTVGHRFQGGVWINSDGRSIKLWIDTKGVPHQRFCIGDKVQHDDPILCDYAESVRRLFACCFGNDVTHSEESILSWCDLGVAKRGGDDGEEGG